MPLTKRLREKPKSSMATSRMAATGGTRDGVHGRRHRGDDGDDDADDERDDDRAGQQHQAPGGDVDADRR